MDPKLFLLYFFLYRGIHSQDLIALAEANKDVKTDGTIHWEKFRLMGDCIMMIMKLQQPKHKVVPDQMILTWLADFSILTEEVIPTKRRLA